MDQEVIKKKRGRKPKNKDLVNNNIVINVEKKKRGRKKKYEIENFQKIMNRDLLNNFNHSVAYSDDEDYVQVADLNVKINPVEEIEKQVNNVSFGNLNITVSKKINKLTRKEPNGLLNSGTANTKKPVIDENEYSDEDKEIEVDEILDLDQEKFEKYYKDNKKYVTNFTENSKKVQKLKRIRVVTTLKNIIKDNDWPDKTDVCCWWCCHKFDNSPCTLPIKYNDLKKSYEFIGIFCSWNCTKAYNNYKNDYKKYERGQLITLLVKQLGGIESAISIKSAPYRECLKMFGGYMSIEDFRNNFSVVDSYSLNLLNFRYVYPEITEVTNVDMKKSNSNLRLARTKK
jgi:hypothetical protein